MNKGKLEKNVLEFIDKCSKEVGKFEAETFDQDVWCYCVEKDRTESPIEQILYCALKYIQKLNKINDWENALINKIEYLIGLNIFSQFKIDKYRCDFFIEYGSHIRGGFQEFHKELIVECDSQQFHERTEKERRYEKARDRYLIMQGYRVFHYTGSEIVKDPLEIAIQILSYITNINYDDFIKNSSYE